MERALRLATFTYVFKSFASDETRPSQIHPLLTRRPVSIPHLVGAKRIVFHSPSRTKTMASKTVEVTVGEKHGARLQIYPDMDALSIGLADFISDVAQVAIAKRGSFSVVLSGGSLVKALGLMASEPRYLQTFDWSKWHVFWADERVVPPSHPDSNYKAAKDEFLSKVPIPACQVYTLPEGRSASQCADEYEAKLRDLTTTGVLDLDTGGVYPSFDVILLGMGPDGHVASLFPHHPLLKETKKWVAPIFDSPKPPPERITLTYPVINSASNVGFVATGAGKAEKLKLVVGPPVSSGSLPAQGVNVPNGTLVWFVDAPAAEGVV